MNWAFILLGVAFLEVLILFILIIIFVLKQHKEVPARHPDQDTLKIKEQIEAAPLATKKKRGRPKKGKL